MEVIDTELKEIVSSLHLKELVLHELTNDMHNRSADIRALRERIQKEIGTTAKAAKKE